ncbi:MAG: hypothetical protein V4710_17895 [Verrucomicrobiota bacterium]
MHPYNEPTVINIPDLCAAENIKEFTNLFIDEICDHHYFLPLDQFCTNGGAGDDVEDDAVEIKEFNKSTVIGTYSFTFCESSPEGSRGRDWTGNHAASIEFVFNRSTGKLELFGGVSKQAYEREEY